MSGCNSVRLGLSILLLTAGGVRAQHGSGGHSHASSGAHPGFPGMPLGPLGGGSGHHGGLNQGSSGLPLAAVGSGYAGYWYGWPYFAGGPVFVPVYYPAPMIMGPGGFISPFGAAPPPMPVRGPLLPPPPPGAGAVQGVKAAAPASNDLGRAGQLLTLGDRFFRAGNLKKAEERYLQARNVASNQAAPQLRLAQVAVARGHYTEAANRLRDAETAQPGWILSAPDIQAIYGEPAEFLRQVARLESFVHAHPDDRDAWLVLGAQWFLSGRTSRASDVFLRLDDPRRKPDVALAAFLFASNHPRPRAEDGHEPTR
jgi:hypothetical protein